MLAHLTLPPCLWRALKAVSCCEALCSDPAGVGTKAWGRTPAAVAGVCVVRVCCCGGTVVSSLLDSAA